MRHTFCRCTEVVEGRSTVVLELPEELRTPVGSVPGPFLLGLADAAGGLAVYSTATLEDYAVTVDLTVHFLAAARGLPVTARATVARRGGRHSVPHVEMTDADGTLCALATGTWAAVPGPSDGPGSGDG